MQDVYKNIEDYNSGKINNNNNNKKFNLIVTEIYIRGRKINISSLFISQPYFKVPKDVRLNSTHFFIMKIPSKTELRQIALNHSSDIDFKDFIKIYEKCAAEPYSFWLMIQPYHKMIL